MNYIDDYIMRQIHLLTQGFAKLFMHKDPSKIELFDENDELSLSGILYHRLKKMVSEGRINEAEDTLFDEINLNPLPSHLRTAMQFYRDLSELSEEKLRASGFSRDEIAQGLTDVARIYEIEPDEAYDGGQ